MTFVPYVLVLISAFTHAYWNFVLKRAQGTHVFVGLSKVAELVLFLAPFLYFVGNENLALAQHWQLFVVGASLALLNYVFLSQAYKSGDLSLVYPVSRAGALLFLPLLAYLFIGERIDWIGGSAILLIAVGLFVLQLPVFNLREIGLVLAKFKSAATLLALAAAFMVACYTLWDKHSINYLPPFVYFYAYTALVGITYAVFMLIKTPWGDLKGEWRGHKFAIVQVGFFNTFSYLLILFSLRTGKASYVIALRQLSIAFGVLLGWKVLREPFPRPKAVGVLLLLAGCLLVSLAR